METLPEQRIGINLSRQEVMVINSQITDWEEQKGYCKPSNHVIKFLRRAGIKDFYYTNVVKTWYPKDYKVKKPEINRDLPALAQELEIVKPKYVLLFGAIAVENTIGGKITHQMGQIIEKDGINYLPCLNPGVLFRDPSKEPYINQALDRFKMMLEGEENEKDHLNIHLLTSKSDIDRAIQNLKDNHPPEIAFDIETTGTNRYVDDINAIGFGNDVIQYELILDKIAYSPLKNMKLAARSLAFYLTEKLADPYFKLIAGNGKFDVLFLWHQYNTHLYLYWDVVSSSHILDENTPNDVKDNAMLKCEAHDWEISLPHKKGQFTTRKEFDEFVEYLGYDIYYEYYLYIKDKEELEQDPSLYNVFMHLTMPALRQYESIETHGIYVNQEKFKEVEKYLRSKINKVHRQMRSYKKGINWNSSQQVSKFLYEELNLPVLERTATGAPASGQDVLKRIQDQHPVIPLIIEYKGLSKQLSGFIEGWKRFLINSRMNPSFKMLTVTGRTSCKDPNLQQIPRDPRIRSLIGAPPGRVFVEADGSQMELRFAGIISGDTELLHAYQVGLDVHTKTYEQIAGKPLSSDKYKAKEERKKAKATNFGFLYGMGAPKFKEYSRDNYGVNVTDDEAKITRTKFFELYHGLPDWHKRQKAIAHSQGQVRNPIGRIRHLPAINSRDKGAVAEAERQAINSPVQGMGSDYTLMAMNEVTGSSDYLHKTKLDRSKFDCVGTVHDAILFEVDADYILEFIEYIKPLCDEPRVVKDVFKFDSPIPISFDVTVGKNWGEGKELDLDGDWRQQTIDYLEKVGEPIGKKKKKRTKKR